MPSECVAMFSPPTRNVPPVGRLSPARMRIRVVLPAPLGPKITNDSPTATLRSIPRKTIFRPNDLVSLRSSIIGGGSPASPAGEPLFTSSRRRSTASAAMRPPVVDAARTLFLPDGVAQLRLQVQAAVAVVGIRDLAGLMR